MGFLASVKKICGIGVGLANGLGGRLLSLRPLLLDEPLIRSATVPRLRNRVWLVWGAPKEKPSVDARGKKALINRTFEKLRRGVCSELYPVYSDNVVVHAPPPLGIQAGPEGVRKCIKVIRRTLETMEPLDRGVMVDMNKVAVHWSLKRRVSLPL